MNLPQPGLPKQVASLVDLLRLRAADQPDRVAYTFLTDGETEAVSLTYAVLDRQVRALAAWLQGQKLAGERALLLYPPGLDYIAAFFGCLYAGVIAVPAYPPRLNRPNDLLQAIVTDAQARLVLTTAEIRARWQDRLADLPALASLPWLATDELATPLATDWQAPAQSRQSLALLQYTSGSTRLPRGVMVSHGNLLHNLELIRHTFHLDPAGLGVFWLPIYHDLGLIGSILEPLYVAGPVLLMSPAAFIERPFRWLQAVSRFQGTISGAPPFAYDLCVAKISPAQRAGLDLSHWQVAICGAERIRPETLERFTAAFAPCGFRASVFYPAYGLAEATLLVSSRTGAGSPRLYHVNRTALAANRVVEARPGETDHCTLVGCGQILPGQTVVIVQPESGRRCPAGQIGEIWLAGPSVAQGYWGRTAETRATFRAYLPDTGAGPFLRTGDLGFLQAGELVVTGRLKDLIILRGRNYYPQDIEQTVAHSHPALETGPGAAFAVEVAGEEKLVVVYEVERSYLRQLDEAEVMAAIRQAIARYHDEVQVHTINLVKPLGLPRTSSGKVQRPACRDRFLAGSLAVIAAWPGPTVPAEAQPDTPPPASEQPVSQLAAAIEAWLAEQLAGQLGLAVAAIDPDQPFDRYGLDSLAAANLAGALVVKLNCPLPHTLLWEQPNLRKLAYHLAQQALGRQTEPAAHLMRRFTTGRLPEFEVVPAPPSLPVPAPPSPPLALPAQSFGEQRLALLNERHQAARAKGHYFYQPVITDQGETWVEIEGRRLLMLASYSYLGLLGHPQINRAVQAAAAKFGAGSHGVRMLAGTTRLHRELEQAIAHFKQSEAALVFASGYVTNLATIATLVGKGQVVICDKLDHASIVDGCALSQARLMVFQHNDMADLERCLQQAGPMGKLVVVDAVFSMDGDIINLPEVVQLCRQYGAYLMVDEAHSLGVLGATGRGIEEHFKLAGEVIDVKMGTLSKTIPSLGGYIAGKAELIAALQHNARAFIFSAALPPPQVAAAQAALAIMQAEPERVTRLQTLVQRYRAGLQALGFNTLNSQTPIVPIVCQSEQQAADMTRLCQAAGLFIVPIVYPAVPLNTPRLRTTVTAAHTDDELTFALDVLARAGRQCGLIGSRK